MIYFLTVMALLCGVGVALFGYVVHRLLRGLFAVVPVKKQRGIVKIISQLDHTQQQIQQSIQAIREQQKNLQVQKKRLELKGGQVELIRRYDGDMILLNKRLATQREALGVAWKTQKLLFYRDAFSEVVLRRPKVKLPELPSEAKGAWVYRKAVTSMRRYIDDVRAKRQAIELPFIDPPPEALVSDTVLHEIETEHLSTLKDFDNLILQLDNFIDRLIYLENWCTTHQISSQDVDYAVHDTALESSLVDISDALSELDRITVEEDMLLDELLEDDVDLQIDKLADVTRDLEARIDAEQELNDMLRTLSRKRQKSKQRI